MSKIISLSGYAGSGKDEAAKALVEERGYQRIAFADVLRDVAYAIDPYVQVPADDPPEFFGLEYIRLQRVINTYGWDYAKNRIEDVRRLLQRIGTEAGRDILGTDIWVETAFGRTEEGTNLVVTDCRFPNEATATKSRGGVVARIHRPGVGPRNSHPSETSLDGWDFDFHIENESSIDVLRAQAIAIDDWLNAHSI